MANQVLKLVYYIIYSLELLVVEEAIFHNRVKSRKCYAVVGGVYLLIMVPTILFTERPSYLIILILNISLYVLLFQGKLWSQVVHFLGVYMFTGMVESMVSGIGIFLLQQSLNNLEISLVSGGVRLLFAVISAVFVFVVVTSEWTQKFIKYFRALKWFQYAAIIMIVLSGTLLMAMSEVILEFIDNKEVGAVLHIVIIFLLGTTFVGIIWFVSNVYGKEYYLKQNQLKEEIIRTQQQYYQNIYENDREMRKFRHDIYSQLGCLQLLLLENKNEQALKHLEMIEGDFKRLSVYKYHTGNEILDVIINQKYLEAKKRGIHICVEGRLNRTDFMDSYNLCTIFVNAINNGVEACESMEVVEKVINVSIVEHGNTVFFQFINPATREMYEAVKQNKTTKEDVQNHGLGVENIRMAVELNRGEMEYRYSDERLILEICFEV